MTDNDKFIEESIRPGKQRRIKKFIKNAGIVTAFGAIFGVVAAGCFYVTNGLLDNKSEKEVKQDVSLVVDTEEPTSTPLSTAKPETSPTIKDGGILGSEPVDALIHYGDMYRELAEYCKDYNSTIVTIAKTSKEMDYFEDQIERTASFYGLVLQISNNTLYALTEYDDIDEDSTYSIILSDNVVVDARMTSSVDKATGLAVMIADISGVDEEVRSRIKIAQIGSSKNIRIGELVVAIGNPMGSMGSIGYGIVCSEPNIEYLTDRSVHIFNTGMQNVERGSGIVMNTSGKVVGVITHRFSSDMNLCSFMGISDLEIIIEQLMNEQERASIGIIPKDIGPDYFEGKEVTNGIYVSDMYAGSAAMESGIVVGDIITEINGNSVVMVEDYMKELALYKPGDTVKVSVYRDYASKNKEREFEVTLTEIQ